MTGATRPQLPRAALIQLPLDDGRSLSARITRPNQQPHALVIALHGAGMSSGYFDVPSHDRSLLARAAHHGLLAVALDRPGYGASREDFPNGLSVDDQATLIIKALQSTSQFDAHTMPWTLFGHSFGAKVALAIAARRDLPVHHVEVSGLGHRSAVEHTAMESHNTRSAVHLHWGPLRCYPEGTFSMAAAELTEPVPDRERAEVLLWPEHIARIFSEVRCSVHFTFAEHEKWWRFQPEDRADLCRMFRQAAVTTSLLKGAGHNASLSDQGARHHEEACQHIIRALR